jgi:hypothetical protein
MGSQGGVQTLAQQAYTASDDHCPFSKSSFLQARQGPAVSITGWKKIKENDAQAMMNALVTVGPLVASIAANGLFNYAGGVIDGCSDNVVNHAVTLMGFGFDTDADMHYWNVRNSWGKAWGEDGFFRLKRAAPGVEEQCGWDNKPADGVVCKDKVGGKYPDRQWVCGECAFLTDTAYPIGTRVPDELMATQASVAETSTGDIESKMPLKDNVWCKTQCQHFGMKTLSEAFDGADFGNDPTTCTQRCDELVPVDPSE